MALDIGPASTTLFGEALADAKTIVWNGPMGMFELAPFSRGTFGLVTFVASAHALSIVGGGDTDTAVHQAGEAARISYISTGGGAFLELLEGKRCLRWRPSMRAGVSGEKMDARRQLEDAPHDSRIDGPGAGHR